MAKLIKPTRRGSLIYPIESNNVAPPTEQLARDCCSICRLTHYQVSRVLFVEILCESLLLLVTLRSLSVPLHFCSCVPQDAAASNSAACFSQGSARHWRSPSKVRGALPPSWRVERARHLALPLTWGYSMHVFHDPVLAYEQESP